MKFLNAVLISNIGSQKIQQIMLINRFTKLWSDIMFKVM